jgi:AcrR family transcriptional regulator
MPSIRSEKKRRAILDAAAELFLSVGYRASMDDVASVAGVSKVTVYNHFRDKHELFTAALADRIERADGGRLLCADDIGPDLERDLRGLARELIVDVVTPEIVRMRRTIIGSTEEFSDIAAAWYDQTVQRTYDQLAALFADLDRLGRLRVGDPVIAAQQFLWLILSVPLNRAMFGVGEIPPTKTDVELLADSGVTTFLAAYGGDAARRRSRGRSRYAKPTT